MARIRNRVPVRVRCVDDPAVAGRVQNRVPVRVVVADAMPDDGGIANVVPVNVIEAVNPQEIDNKEPFLVFPVSYSDEAWHVSNAEPLLVYVESGTLCGPVVVSALLLEGGDALLLESGDGLLLE